MAEQHSLVVSEAAAGERIDRYLAIIPELGISRAVAQRLLDDGHVTLNGARVRASQRLRPGDRLLVELPPPQPSELVAQPIALEVVYEDASLLVVNKPPGLVVHPAPGHPDGTLVNALLHHCPDLPGIGGVQRPGIVHRIDRDTSGLLVIAKEAAAHEFLARLFQGHRIERRYRALLHCSHRLPEVGTFRTLYGRHPQDRKRFSSRVTQGRTAITHWQVEERLGTLAIITVRLETGRSHQIRVHFSDHGHPLVGDPVYGGTRADGRLPAAQARLVAQLGRQALHAELLGFPHPKTGASLLFEAPLAPDLDRLFSGLRDLPALGEGIQPKSK